MDLTIDKQGDGITFLRLVGKMDIDGTGEVDLKLSAATTEDKAQLVADLSGVSFMSSIGIGVLLRAVKTARRRGGNMVLLNPQPVVRLVLEKTGIPQLVEICDTMESIPSALAKKFPGR
jgi:anti-sigma B factor antagonist